MKEQIRNKCCTKSKEIKERKVVEEDLICSYCGYTRADKRTLDRHINGVHLKQGLTNVKNASTARYDLMMLKDILNTNILVDNIYVIFAQIFANGLLNLINT